MPRILVGQTTLSYSPDGDDIVIDEVGKAEATLEYVIPSGFTISDLPRPRSPHPVYTNLQLYEVRASRQAGELFKVTCSYRGVQGGADGSGTSTIYTSEEFSSTTSAEPIKTHPRYAFPVNDPPVSSTELNGIEQAIENKIVWDAQPGATEAGRNLYSKLVRGVDSYLATKSVYSRSYAGKIIPNKAALVGKIYSPQGAPPLPKDQNYLFSGMSWTRSGGVVTTKEEYMASGRTGWDKDLYT